MMERSPNRMDPAAAQAFAHIIFACDALQKGTQALRRRYRDDARLLEAWRPLANDAIAKAMELDDPEQIRVALRFVTHRCDEALSSARRAAKRPAQSRNEATAPLQSAGNLGI